MIISQFWILGFPSERGADENELAATVGAGDENKERRFFLNERGFCYRAMMRTNTVARCRRGSVTTVAERGSERGAVIDRRAAIHFASAAVQDHRSRASHKSVVAMPRKQNVAQRGIASVGDLEGVSSLASGPHNIKDTFCNMVIRHIAWNRSTK